VSTKIFKEAEMENVDMGARVIGVRSRSLAAFMQISQEDADKVIELAIEAGINHIDVAPSYGQAEIRIGPWMPRERERFFLGCKTLERAKEGAWNEMQRSLQLLQTETFDLYQFHAVTTMEELDAITMKGGALEAFVEARREGLTKFIGITGHGAEAPKIYLEALRRFDFDAVMFPLNFVQMANPEFGKYAEELITTCKAKDVGTLIIKSITKAPWGERQHTATTWYEPFDKSDEIHCSEFLFYPMMSLACTAGYAPCRWLSSLRELFPLNKDEMEEMIESGKQYEPLFA
jgi:aryl-alcohol dehydrogenase-like predicted oxidoreductase